MKERQISFYRYVIIDSPYELRDELYESWKELGVLGRIYLAHEGVNAQLSVPESNFEEFVKLVHANPFLPICLLKLPWKMMEIHFLN